MPRGLTLAVLFLMSIAQMALYKSDRRQVSQGWYLPPGTTLDRHVAKQMFEQASPLADDVIVKLPNIFAERPVSPFPEPLVAQRVARGQALAEGRRCQTCHGATYNGRDVAPRLTGQNPLCTEKPLKGVRTRKREHPQDAGIAALTDREARDLSHFFASLKSPDLAGGILVASRGIRPCALGFNQEQSPPAAGPRAPFSRLRPIVQHFAVRTGRSATLRE